MLVQQLQLYYDLGQFNKEYLDTTVDKSMAQIKHMSQTIEDFRTFFKPDKGKVKFSVRKAVMKALALVDDSFKSQQITIDFQVKNHPAAIGFPNEYSQVLLNILMNAKDALSDKRPENPKVMVAVSKEGERAIVSITDNAGGIPDDIIDKIFEPYFTTKGPAHGTGVGLFMSKTIIEKNMHGKLSVCNTSDGAEFRIEV